MMFLWDYRLNTSYYKLLDSNLGSFYFKITYSTNVMFVIKAFKIYSSVNIFKIILFFIK